MTQIKKYVYNIIVLTVVVLVSISCVDKSLCYFHFESISQPKQWTESDSLLFDFSQCELPQIGPSHAGLLMWKLEAITSTDYLFDLIRVETTRVGDSICQVDTINMHIVTDKSGIPIKHFGSQRYMSSDVAFGAWKADTIRRVIVRPLISDRIYGTRKHYTGITDIGLSVQRLVSKK